jgi:putative addiction module component (TIGR02574 family)
MSTAILDKLLELSAQERLELAEALWHSLADEAPDQVPIPDWHRELLDERLAAMDSSGEKGEPWEQVLANIKREA